MRSTLLVAALLVAACSGSSEDKKPDGAPVEQPDEPTTAAPEAAAEPETAEESEAAKAPPALDLDAVEDLETLFEVSGGVDKDQVSGIIGQKKPDIHKCYGDALAANPGMAGRVLVQITTTPSGGVASAMVKQSTLKKPAVETCMVSKMRTWKFPNNNGGGLVIIKYAFQLPP